MKFKLLQTFKVNNTLGEGCVWDHRIHSLWWTDIEEKTLFKLDWQSQQVRHFNLPDRACSFCLTNNPEILLIAFSTGIAKYNTESNSCLWLIEDILSRGKERFNDGKIDKRGCFWISTMAEDDSHKSRASLYHLNTSGLLKKITTGITCGNSLCFSQDNRRMYFADSPTLTIQKYYLQEDGVTIKLKTDFAKTAANQFPDGSELDTDEYLWNAVWGANRIDQYTPEGERIGNFKVPVKQPTCVTFGGPDMDILFVTSATYKLSEPSALDGALLAYDVNSQGIESPIFDLSNLNKVLHHG